MLIVISSQVMAFETNLKTEKTKSTYDQLGAFFEQGTLPRPILYARNVVLDGVCYFAMDKSVRVRRALSFYENANPISFLDSTFHADLEKVGYQGVFETWSQLEKYVGQSESAQVLRMCKDDKSVYFSRKSHIYTDGTYFIREFSKEEKTYLLVKKYESNMIESIRCAFDVSEFKRISDTKVLYTNTL
jgi:hypothetical protein